MSERVDPRKTYKLFVGGAFPRSESGRTFDVRASDGTFLANAAWASRKDARDAVVAARSALPKWMGATAYNRGQVLYRVAEVLAGRRDQFVADIAATTSDVDSARAEVDASIDRWVYYAGWTDKLSQVRGTVNSVAGPYIVQSVPEATGVVAVLAPERPQLLALTSVLAPVMASGCTAVVVAPSPLPAVALAEVLATSDVPAGTVNILTGFGAELGPVLASHMDVNAIDLAGADAELARTAATASAQTLMRVRQPSDEAWFEVPGDSRLRWLLETKTIWQPQGV